MEKTKEKGVVTDEIKDAEEERSMLSAMVETEKEEWRRSGGGVEEEEWMIPLRVSVEESQKQREGNSKIKV